MSGSVEIKVDKKELEISEKKLAALYKNIANRKVKIGFTDTQGAVVEELMAVEKQLNDIAKAIATIIKKTENAVANTKATFTVTDEMLAQWFGIMEE